MIKLKKLANDNINEIYKIKRTSEKYVGLIEDILDNFNEIYKKFSDLVGIYLDEKIIGLVVLCFEPLNGKWSFTDLVIDENYQQKGYGILATQTIIDYFKNKKESNIIQIEIFKENIKAIRCYEKCGFKITKECDWDNNFLEMEIIL